VQTLLFTSLPAPQPRWKSFVLGWNLQALLVVCLILVNTRFHQKLADAPHYRITNLVSYESAVEPQHVNSKVITDPKPLLRPAKDLSPALAAVMVSPKIRAMSERKPPQPEPIAPEVKFESKMPALANSETLKIVAVNTFSTRSPVMPKVVETPTAVQTGGFGAVRATSGSQDRGAAMVAPQGSFDLPMGPGNGTGSNQGSVMSAGFSTQSATVGEKGAGRIQQSGFDAHRSGTKPETVASNLPTTPVEIIFKPKPDYTDEARELRISGEVRLQVLFTASGQVHVISVLQGLGYGLDAKAVKAAEQIKFKPALHVGQPVDSTAVVHIVFDLVS
jgi:TonB family protein